jgi:hypothetical protein
VCCTGHRAVRVQGGVGIQGPDLDTIFLHTEDASLLKSFCIQVNELVISNPVESFKE